MKGIGTASPLDALNQVSGKVIHFARRLAEGHNGVVSIGIDAS